DHHFRVILTLPEMIFGHPVFSRMMRNSDWTKDILGTVIDEAHCVLEWKDKFRTAFNEIEKVRSYLPGKPIFAASATLTLFMIDSLISTLSFARGNTFMLNVGNNRPNLTPDVCCMAGGENNFEALDFLLDEVDGDKPLVHTMVFFKTRDLACQAGQYIKSKLPEDSLYCLQVFSLWATKSCPAKRKIMKRFCDRKIMVLFATEVAGMGMDLGHIQRVVQYMIPDTLTQFTQHAGRAGRDGAPAMVILLVEPLVFKKRPEAGDTDDFEYCRRKVETSMQSVAATDGCRREVADIYYGNPRGNRRKVPLHLLCPMLIGVLP
ncbi:P-loop containing nucleoside triphosphate hydrolase protein, partial [Cytidiella melzeri]